MNKERIINFKIDQELADKLERVKIIEDRSLSSISRVSIKKYCEEVLKNE